MTETCADCNGSGTYVGFMKTEGCPTCAGSGVQDATPRSETILGALDRVILMKGPPPESTVWTLTLHGKDKVDEIAISDGPGHAG